MVTKAGKVKCAKCGRIVKGYIDASLKLLFPHRHHAPDKSDCEGRYLVAEPHHDIGRI